MLINRLIWLFNNPKNWQSLRDQKINIIKFYATEVIWITLFPVTCTFLGITINGWSIPGLDHLLKLDKINAMLLSIASWLAINAAIIIISWLILWCGRNFKAKPTMADCIVFSTYILSPFFILGIFALFPSLWLAMTLIIVAIFFSCYFLYTGISYYMNINKEQGFLYAGSIICISLVILVGMMGVTIIFWIVGVEPTFISVY